jgi:hypothetical protein
MNRTNTKPTIAPPSPLTLRKTTLRALGNDSLRRVVGGDPSRLGFCHLPETQAPDPGDTGILGDPSLTTTR